VAAEAHEQTDDPPREVELPPTVAVPRRCWISMVIVVPAFATAYEADDGVVATVVGRLVVPVTPDMSQRIYRPRRVPDEYRSQRSAQITRLAANCKASRTLSPVATAPA